VIGESCGQTVYVQIVEESDLKSQWTANYLKRGIEKKLKVAEESKVAESNVA